MTNQNTEPHFPVTDFKKPEIKRISPTRKEEEKTVKGRGKPEGKVKTEGKDEKNITVK